MADTPTEAEQRETLRDALESMVCQFAYHGTKDGAPTYITGGLSALEHAFEVLGWDDPHPCPEHKCQREGCAEMATCGRPTAGDGYGRVCGDHYIEAERAEEAARGEFSLGTRVTWQSQSAGHTTRKHGTVLQVVQAGETIEQALKHRGMSLDDFTIPTAEFGMSRKLRSYLVVVERKTPRLAKPLLYWPRVAHLRRRETP